MFKQNYMKGLLGNVFFDEVDSNTILLRQEDGNGATKGGIHLPLADMEKLAKGLFARKKEMEAKSQAKANTFSVQPTKPTKTTEKAIATCSTYMQQQKESHPNAYIPWTKEEEDKLKDMVQAGLEVKVISDALQRNEGAITSRMKKLGL